MVIVSKSSKKLGDNTLCSRIDRKSATFIKISRLFHYKVLFNLLNCLDFLAEMHSNDAF
jgi:hypothetical protein